MDERITDIERLFSPGDEAALAAYLHLLHPTDLVQLLELVPEENWLKLTRQLSDDALGEMLSLLDENRREEIGALISTKRLIEVVDDLETDDAADVLGDLSEAQSAAVLEELEDKAEIATLLTYAEDTAGGIMQTEVCRVDIAGNVLHAIEAVRHIREEIDDVLDIYLVDSKGRLAGLLALEDLILSDQETPLQSLCQAVDKKITVDLDQEEVARLFGKFDVTTLPVVDGADHLLGRITFDDVHDVIEEEATEDVMTMAGAAREDLVYTSDFFRIAGLRLPWLLTTMLGSLITTQLIPLFAHVSTEPLILAAFVPVVTAMTGNIGAQSAMIITRGFAIGRVDFSTLGRAFFRESTVALMMAAVAGTAVGLFGWFRHGDYHFGMVLCGAMICSMSAASIFGVGAPAVFKRFGVDPAIAAGPLVTMCCDILGVSIYLLAALLML